MMEESVSKLTLLECHRVLSHLHPEAITNMIVQGRCKGIIITDREWRTCESCAKMKASKQIQPRYASRKFTKPGVMLSADLCGPVAPKTVGGAQYVSVIIDHFSSYTDIKLLKSKESTEVLQHFQEFIATYERQSGNLIKTIRTDNGKEYTSKLFEDFLTEKGIIHGTTSPHSPAQNDKAERKNRTLFEATRSMIEQSGLSKTYWGEAITNACYTQNRLPHSALDGKSPIEILTGKIPLSGK